MRCAKRCMILRKPRSRRVLPATLILMFAPTFALLIEGMSKAVP